MSALSHRSEWTPGEPAAETRTAGADARSDWNRREMRQFRWMVAVALPLLLAVATVARLSGWRWKPWPPSGKEYRSVLQEATEAAETCISFAFGGW
jgi:hypothetical protein